MFSNRIRTAYVAAIGLALVIALAAGCGGSGGGTSGSTQGATINVQYVIGGLSSVTVPALSPGDQVQLTATATIQGVTSPLSPYNYVVSGGSAVGAVSGTGLFTAGAGITVGSTYSVSASSNEGPVHWNFTASPPLTQPEILGIVGSSGAGVQGVTVTAYDVNMNAVGSATTAADGTFTMPVSANAVQFGVSLGAVQGGAGAFYQQFGYGGNQYTTSSPACLPSLPGLSSGNHKYYLPNQITLSAANGPPPPPASCLG